MLFLLDGGVWERMLRDRGRFRSAISKFVCKQLKRRLTAFVRGDWHPPIVDKLSPYPISLTSWTPRLNSLPLVLLTLLGQSVRPRQIVVWLTSQDLELLSNGMRMRFEKHGVRFSVCDNLKSHKKWLPMVEAGERSPFVICDDDVIYPPRWFSMLISEDRADAYVGVRCHRIKDSAGRVAPYSAWEKQVCSDGCCSHKLFITGCGGAVVHPKRIRGVFLDREVLTRECPNADDIWLKAAHLAAGVPCYKTWYSFPCLDLPDTNESGLAVDNVDAGGNDHQIRNLSQYFSLVSESARKPVRAA